jgi:translation initiation factor IF-3
LNATFRLASGPIRIIATGDNSIDRKQRVNEQIRAPQVRLIGPAGEQFGILSSADAIAKAREANLDLVEVSPADQPPVVRIMDFGKFKYDKAKRQHKSPGHQSKLKEIRVRPKTDAHDIETKVKQARRFLEARDKVLVTMVFRGRELAHFEEGGRLLAGLISQLDDLAVVETPPARQAKRMSCLLAPR